MTLADEGGVLGYVVVTLTPAGQPATTHTTLMPWAEAQAEARSWRARCDGRPYWVCPITLHEPTPGGGDRMSPSYTRHQIRTGAGTPDPR